MSARLLFVLLLAFFANSTLARSLEESIPEALQVWVPWVLYDHEEHQCPHAYNGSERYCAWPGKLWLELDTTGGRFVQTWEAFSASWVGLPGSKNHWPQDVQADGEPVPVQLHEGLPQVKLVPGKHRINGRFNWNRLPDSLKIPALTGLLGVMSQGAPIVHPDIDKDGRLWLGEREAQDGKVIAERLEFQVFRRVIDDNPLQLITHLDLDVAGTPREVLLGSVLLDGFIPLRIESPLPARLEADGRLRLQVRAGRWALEVTGRFPTELNSLDAAAVPEPWPQTEVWVFEARNALRLVEVEGVPTVDPRQTRLPSGWQELPAYRMQPTDTMRFRVIRRGDPQPEPDQLSLQRDLWLDFAGGGYSIRDRIQGSLTRSWRLQTQPELRLGQVRVDGEPQFITRLEELDRPGVEVRRGALDLTADSRYTEAVGTLPASGWELDFQRMQATLHLPPGWRLFAAAGVDNPPASWLQRWTLLDLFLVLVTAIAIGRLWTWVWGLIGLVTLILIWHEPGAPHFVWLNLLAAIALLRVLPSVNDRSGKGRLRKSVQLYYRLTLVGLLLIAVPFLVAQVRTGLYPQLEQPWQTMGQETVAPVAESVMPPSPSEALQDEEEVMRDVPASRRKLAQYPSSPEPKREMLTRIDPKARVQTGPGLPHWQWSNIHLAWNGPVSREQRLDVWLIPPGGNLLLNGLRVLLVLLLGLHLAGVPVRLRGLPAGGAVGAACMMLAVAGLAGLPSQAEAEGFPPSDLLQQLQTRLLEAPDCLPGCAAIPRLGLETREDGLVLRLEVDAQTEISLPLPGSSTTWRPARILLDDSAAEGVILAPEGVLWVRVPAGRHQLLLSGPLPSEERIQLPLPLRPHQVEVMGAGWRVEGIDANGVPGHQLQLVRLGVGGDQVAGRLKPSTLPPLLRLVRTLRLGLDWRVENRVERLSPPNFPVLVSIPLLPGESVTTEGLQVQGEALLVSLRSGQRSLAWTSTLDPVSPLVLTAVENNALSESWRADVSPIWHVRLAGIPVVHHQGQGQRWLPEWRPWPGEQAILTVTRPQGVAGPTLTFDRSQVQVKPGRRATEVQLSLTVRSSQGGQHRIQLPAEAQLQRVTIDGSTQPLRPDGRHLTLPLVPGAQRFQLEWRQPTGIGTYYVTPQVDLGSANVNASVGLGLGADRWILFLGGPAVGPAVLFWGVLIVISLLALGLGRVRAVPLRSHDWLLLGIGLSQAELWLAVLVVAWLFALAGRQRLDQETEPLRFNLAQVGLALLTLFALTALFTAVQQGLLGLPEMQIAGNGSDAFQLNWYQDRAESLLPQAWVLSVPVLVYRLLMLAWAMWLAFSLLKWLRWGWGAFARPVIWREVKFHLPGRGQRERRPQSKQGDST